MTIRYRNRAGELLWKPSIEQLQEMDDNGEGFCLACGEVHSNIEPDAAAFPCESCDADKVYGASELALRGIYH